MVNPLIALGFGFVIGIVWYLWKHYSEKDRDNDSKTKEKVADK